MATTALSLLLVAFCWGGTNPFIKRGSIGLEQVQKQHKDSPWITRTLAEWGFLVTRWQYILPLALNLSGSAVYYYTLGNADLKLIVPITNSLTFALTVFVGWLLGEEIGTLESALGVVLVFIGVLLMLE